jgi:hypothetical protein
VCVPLRLTEEDWRGDLGLVLLVALHNGRAVAVADDVYHPSSKKKKNNKKNKKKS